MDAWNEGNIMLHIFQSLNQEYFGKCAAVGECKLAISFAVDTQVLSLLMVPD
jgi:hypothetical protein